MARFYLRLEGVNLNRFVYDTTNLNAVRGGGLLLLDAPERVRERFNFDRVATGASSGLYSFEADDITQAESVCKQVRDFLDQDSNYKHATFVVDILAAGDEEDFPIDHEKLLALNRWQQMNAPSLAVPATNSGFHDPCEIDLVRPAYRKRKIKIKGENKSVSRSIRQRVTYGRRKKQSFFEERSGIRIPRHPAFAFDLDELTSDEKQGLLNHKMAVIYLDGNGFGKIRDEICKTREKLIEFDTRLKDGQKQWLVSLIELMESEEGWISNKDRYRIEVLLWGGDEIIWVVPAWKGWQTLALLFETARSWEKFGDHRLTHAAGIVFCHHNAPINRIKELVEKLADLAKTKDRRSDLFAYEVLESFDYVSGNLLDYRKERCPQPIDPDLDPDPSILILSPDGMEGIIAHARKLKDVIPRRKLTAIVRELLRKNPGEVRKKKLENLDEELRSAIESAGAKDSLKEITSFFNKDKEARWLHLDALWDYLD